MAELYSRHPLSECFPPMLPGEFLDLKESIEQIGLQSPVTIFGGMIIDGWHRYSACLEVCMPCEFVHLNESIDPRDFVISQNKARRHLTQSQIALATTACWAWHSTGFNQSNRVDPEEPPYHLTTTKTTKQLAELAGVHQSTIKRSKLVLSKGGEELVAAVKSGKIGLKKAAALASMNDEDRPADIFSPLIKSEPVDECLDSLKSLNSELLEHIEDLKKSLSIFEKNSSDFEKIMQLTVNLRVVTVSRDDLMNENAKIKSQNLLLKKEIEKLKSKT